MSDGLEPAAPWTPPKGYADVAPSRFERIEGDGYLTIDAHWIVPALLGAMPIKGRVLEPAAGADIYRLSSNAPALSSSPSTSGPTKIRSSPTSGSVISASSNRSPDSLGW